MQKWIPDSFAYRVIVPLVAITVGGAFLAEWSARNIALSLLCWFVVGCLGVEITLHRYFAHRAFKLHPVVEKILTAISIYGAQHSPIWWRAVHMRHHSDADTERDVHSPAPQGFWYALIGWYFVHDARTVSLRPSADLLQDRFLRFVHSHYYKLFWTAGALLAAFDAELGYFCFVVPAFLAFMQTNLVNGFCHLPCIGARPFATRDNSANVAIVGYLSWGLGFHNNHHAFPSSYALGRRWWEFDPCRWIIPLIARGKPSSPWATARGRQAG